MSHRTNLLRNLCLSNPRVAKTIARKGVDEAGIRAILDDATAMESFLRMIARVTRDEITHMIAPSLTGAAFQPATQNEIETIYMVNQYG